MAEEAFYLSAADRDLLSDMLDDYRRRPGNSQRRPAVPGQRFQAPDVYLAKVPSGGIPALSQHGTTGTGSDQPMDDVPGKAECQVYQLDTVTNPTAPAFHRVGEITYWVYNLTPTAISADHTPWVLIQRDKFGEWFFGGLASPDQQITITALTGVIQTNCGLIFQKAVYTITGANLAMTTTDVTGTGTGADGNDITYNFPTQKVVFPNFPITATFNPDCTITITATDQEICVPYVHLPCCADYTGTGT